MEGWARAEGEAAAPTTPGAAPGPSQRWGPPHWRRGLLSQPSGLSGLLPRDDRPSLGSPRALYLKAGNRGTLGPQSKAEVEAFPRLPASCLPGPAQATEPPFLPHGPSALPGRKEQEAIGVCVPHPSSSCSSARFGGWFQEDEAAKSLRSVVRLEGGLGAPCPAVPLLSLGCFSSFSFTIQVPFFLQNIT